jgi:hypothetical protein
MIQCKEVNGLTISCLKYAMFLKVKVSTNACHVLRLERAPFDTNGASQVLFY